jgi:hypothetical protein
MLAVMRCHAIRAVTAATAITALLGGCGAGGGDRPAVCDSLSAVQASVDDLRNANVSENGLSQLRSDLGQLKVNLDQLSQDARAQLQPQIDGVRAAAGQLSSSVTAAKSDPSAATFAGVRTAVAGVADSVQGLGAAMSGTC